MPQNRKDGERGYDFLYRTCGAPCADQRILPLQLFGLGDGVHRHTPGEGPVGEPRLCASAVLYHLRLRRNARLCAAASVFRQLCAALSCGSRFGNAVRIPHRAADAAPVRHLLVGLHH